MPHWKPITDFDLTFDLSGFDRLHDFAFLAMQENKLKNEGDWFGHFLGGEYGLRARLLGVTTHYQALHSWKPAKRDTEEMDYHLASILFGIDSAIECCTYMLNALGWASLPSGFADVSNDKSLKGINPSNILGMATKPTLMGYAAVFPAVQKLWLKNYWMIGFLMDQHDASKHRQATIVTGGRMRSDPPSGFFEQLGIAGDVFDQQEYTPPMEVLLLAGVKTPNLVRSLGRGVHAYRLEDAAMQFSRLISRTGVLAEQNARKYIKLPRKRLRF